MAEQVNSFLDSGDLSSVITLANSLDPSHNRQNVSPGLGVLKLEFILRLKIKHNDWLLADTCLPAANHCALF